MGKLYTPGDVHIQQALTDLAVKYANEETIWREIAPVKQVGKRSDKYYVFDKNNDFQTANDTLAPNAMPNEFSMSLSNDNYSVVDYGLGVWIPRETIDNADDPLDILGAHMENLRARLDTAHEVRVATKFFAAATYPTANKATLSGTSQWSDYTNSDPLAAIEDAIDAMIVKPNKLILGADTWRVLRRHPKVTAALFPLGGNAATAGANATAEQLASYLGLDRVVVGRRRYNSANEGQNASLARIWGKHALLARVVDNPGTMDVTLGLTFSETLSAPVDEEDRKRGVKGSVYLKDAWNCDVKTVASDAGYLFTNAVA